MLKRENFAGLRVVVVFCAKEEAGGFSTGLQLYESYKVLSEPRSNY